MKSFYAVLLMFLFSLIFSLPWWLTVLLRHGIDPFVNFIKAGSVYRDFATYPHLITLSFTDEPFLSILGSLGLLGLFLSLARGSFFLFVWFLTPLIFAPRSSPNLVVVPLTFAVSESINFLYLSLNKGKESLLRELRFKPRIYIFVFRAFLIYLFFYLVFSTLSLSYLAEKSYFDSIQPGELEAMEWVKKNTDVSSKFLIITENEKWGMDPVLEWFPALSDRESILTPQGSEWLPNDSFYVKASSYFIYKDGCKGLRYCLEDVLFENYQDFDYLFVSGFRGKENILNKIFCDKNSISDRFDIIFDNHCVKVFRKLGFKYSALN